MKKELESHKDNQTWEEVKESRNYNIVDCRWVFVKKHDAKGALIRYKARLVARGFTQIPGVDFDETFAPVARYESLRMLIQHAATMNYDIHQMDFNTAYLNSSL